MRTTLYVCLAVGALALCVAKAAASPIEGTWEGSIDGLKAVTLTVREANGKIEGRVIFYVLRDEGAGKRIGGHTDLALVEPKWDGRMLRFSVEVPGAKAGDAVRSFEMTVTGPNAAELKRLASSGEREQTVALQRHN